MERDGQLIRNRREGYGLVTKMNLVTGRVIGHPEGHGFLIPDEGGDNLFLSPRQMRKLLHGDRAVARVIGVDYRGRREGAVVEVLERNTETVVGAFQRGARRLLRHSRQQADQSGHHGAGGRTRRGPGRPDRHRRTDRTAQRAKSAAGPDQGSAGRTHGAGHGNPHRHRQPRHPGGMAGGGVGGGEPLRRVRAGSGQAGPLGFARDPLVTIDGITARDFDDAVYCERRGANWRLLVAIADVSWYVRPGTALDQEARKRGNSVYFPDRAIPMLPEALSNGLCSLNPDVDRLCMVCEMTFNAEGRMIRSRFAEAVMRSQARLTYDTVAAIVADRDPHVRAEYAALVPHLDRLHELYQVLRAGGTARGDGFRHPGDGDRVWRGSQDRADLPTERNDAHRLIEECMIAANVAAARFLQRHKMPGLVPDS
jgi:ribonuclease R